MIRSPLHLLISLQRFLYRTKARHKSNLLFSRPISKSTSWSATISLRIPRASPISTKSIPSSVQQEPSHQLLRMTQRPSPATLSSTSRRLLTSRQSPGQSHAALYIQYRTMLSSGNTTNHQVTTILNPAQFFTTRPPILGVHGGIIPPPTPHSSLRSYANKPPWANQQHHQMGPSSPLTQSSSIEIDMDDVDDNNDDDFCNNIQYHRHIDQRISTTTTSIAATQNTNSKQQSYRPPNTRGMADLMDNGNECDNYITQVDADENGNNRHSSGLIHRSQPPRKWSPQPKQSVTSMSTRRMSAMNVLRHDDLSLQTTKKRQSSATLPSATDTTSSSSTAPNDDNSNTFLDLTQHWYISVPMDLTFLMQPDNSSPTSTFSSATGNLFFMENAVSVLDPIWMKSFDQWGKLIRSHLTKVMVLIQLVGLEAQRYYSKGRRRHSANDATGRCEHDDRHDYSNISTGKAAALTNRRAATATATTTTTTMDFKMLMMKKANIPSELRIYLPHQLCTPLPTTIQNIQHWVHQLMNDPPTFEIKFGTKDDIRDSNGEIETAHYGKNLATAMMADDLFNTSSGGCTDSDDRRMDMDDLPEDNCDDEPWRIGPHYFQGIHSFLNHVDSMIDSSPAFATGGQRRFSL